MNKYIISRFLQIIIVLFGLSLLIFFIARVVPGDPTRIALGALATEEQIQELREEMHLDKTIFTQYYFWFRSLIRGDLGESLYSRRPVLTDIRKLIPATFELIIFSFLISIIIGQIIGVLAGYFRDSWLDNSFRFFSYIGIAVPPFVVAIFFLLIFTYTFHLTPAVGRISIWLKPPPHITGFYIIDSLITGQLNTAWDAVKHIFLPSLSLAVANIAQEGRITRSSIINNLQKDFITAHVVYGIPMRPLIFKYLLRPSLIPTVSIMGLDFACQIANAFLVELVFMWPGFSRYGINAILTKDLNAIIAVVLIIGITYAIINVFVDIIIAFLDPRIQLKTGGK